MQAERRIWPKSSLFPVVSEIKATKDLSGGNISVEKGRLSLSIICLYERNIVRQNCGCQFTLLQDIIRVIHGRKIFCELSDVKTCIAGSGKPWTTTHRSLRSAPGRKVSSQAFPQVAATMEIRPSGSSYTRHSYTAPAHSVPWVSFSGQSFNYKNPQYS